MHQEHLVVDFVDHAVVTHPDAQQPRAALESLGAGRAGIVAQRVDGVEQAALHGSVRRRVRSAAWVKVTA